MLEAHNETVGTCSSKRRKVGARAKLADFRRKKCEEEERTKSPGASVCGVTGKTAGTARRVAGAGHCSRGLRDSLASVLAFLMLQSPQQDPLLESTASAAAGQPRPLAPRLHPPQTRRGVILLSVRSWLKVTDATPPPVTVQSCTVLHWNLISIPFICYVADVDSGCIVSM